MVPPSKRQRSNGARTTAASVAPADAVAAVARCVDAFDNAPGVWVAVCACASDAMWAAFEAQCSAATLLSASACAAALCGAVAACTALHSGDAARVDVALASKTVFLAARCRQIGGCDAALFDAARGASTPADAAADALRDGDGVALGAAAQLRWDSGSVLLRAGGSAAAAVAEGGALRAHPCQTVFWRACRERAVAIGQRVAVSVNGEWLCGRLCALDHGDLYHRSHSAGTSQLFLGIEYDAPPPGSPKWEVVVMPRLAAAELDAVAAPAAASAAGAAPAAGADSTPALPLPPWHRHGDGFALRSAAAEVELQAAAPRSVRGELTVAVVCETRGETRGAAAQRRALTRGAASWVLDSLKSSDRAGVFAPETARADAALLRQHGRAAASFEAVVRRHAAAAYAHAAFGSRAAQACASARAEQEQRPDACVAALCRAAFNLFARDVLRVLANISFCSTVRGGGEVKAGAEAAQHCAVLAMERRAERLLGEAVRALAPCRVAATPRLVVWSSGAARSHRGEPDYQWQAVLPLGNVAALCRDALPCRNAFGWACGRRTLRAASTSFWRSTLLSSEALHSAVAAEAPHARWLAAELARVAARLPPRVAAAGSATAPLRALGATPNALQRGAFRASIADSRLRAFQQAHVHVRRAMGLKVTSAGEVQCGGATLYRCNGGRDDPGRYGEMLPPLVHLMGREFVRLQSVGEGKSRRDCGFCPASPSGGTANASTKAPLAELRRPSALVFEFGSGLGNVACQFAFETNSIVIAIELAPALHGAGVEYAARMRAHMQATLRSSELARAIAGHAARNGGVRSARDADAGAADAVAAGAAPGHRAHGDEKTSENAPVADDAWRGDGSGVDNPLRTARGDALALQVQLRHGDLFDPNVHSTYRSARGSTTRALDVCELKKADAVIVNNQAFDDDMNYRLLVMLHAVLPLDALVFVLKVRPGSPGSFAPVRPPTDAPKAHPPLPRARSSLCLTRTRLAGHSTFEARESFLWFQQCAQSEVARRERVFVGEDQPARRVRRDSALGLVGKRDPNGILRLPPHIARVIRAQNCCKLPRGSSYLVHVIEYEYY